jgi:hypothetical protein
MSTVLTQGSSVTSNAPHLVCEGESDRRLLEQLYDGREIMVEDVSGEGSLRGAAAYLRQRGRKVFTVRDRNFRPLAETEACFQPDYAGNHFTWRRHELENYLLEPPVLLACLQDLAPEAHPRADLYPVLPGTQEEAWQLLERAARGLIEDQAGRYANWLLHWRVREALPQSFPLRPSREIRDRAAWERELMDQAADLRRHQPELVALMGLTDDEVCQVYADCLAEYNASDFWSERRYLRDFGGHELVRWIHHWLDVHRPGGYKATDLEQDLARTFVALWDEARGQPEWLQPNDFAALRMAIRRVLAAPSG